MTAAPALTWTCLLPQETSYHPTFDAPWLRELLISPGRHSGRVLVLTGETSSQIAGFDGYDGVVGLNSPGLTDRRLQAAGLSHIQRFAVLPSLSRPRWFIPIAGGTLKAESASAVSASAFRLYMAMKPLARAMRLGLRTAARFNLPGWYRDNIVVAQRGPSPLAGVLQPLFPGRSIHLALSAGSPPPTRNRKISIAVLDDVGEPIAFVKLPGGTPASIHSVTHEAEVLKHLAGRTPRVRAAKLLLSGTVGTSDLPISVTKPLGGRVPGFTLTEGHLRFLRSLQSPCRVKARESGIVTSLHGRFEQLRLIRQHPKGLEAIGQALPIVMRALGDVRLPSTIVHGDFSPWNLREIGGEVQAYDWESSELSGLPLIDATHHLLSIGYLVRHWSAEEAAQRLEKVAHSGALGPQGTVMALQMIYLLDYMLRLHSEGYDDGYPRAVWCRQILTLLIARTSEAKS